MKHGMGGRQSWSATLGGLCVLAMLSGGLFASTAHADVNRDIYSYVLFAYDQLVFQGGNTNAGYGYITGGNIGVQYAGRSPTGESLAIGTSNWAIMSDGTQVAADSVRIGEKASMYNLYANSVVPLNYDAASIRGTGPTPYSTPTVTNLPALPFAPGRALTDNAGSLTIGGNGNPGTGYVFLPGAYGDVRINDDMVVNFGAGEFDIRDFSLGKNVTVNVTDQTELWIDRGFDPNDGLKFGLGTAAGCKIYVGAFGYTLDVNGQAQERSGSFSNNPEIHAQYFSPTGWLDIGSEADLFGRFWAQRITGDPNNNVTFVPEPTTSLLVLLGVSGVGALLKRRDS